MAELLRERVTSVHHWNDKLFSFRVTRERGLQFSNGQFVMVGLEVDGKPLTRAYSIASANYDDEMEFFSIKVPNGPLTSRLQHLQVGDEVLVSNKPTGTLLVDYLLPGRNLYLVSTGTGLAPFLAVIRDPEVYERFDRIILTHGVRQVSDLAYRELIEEELPQDEYLGDEIRKKLLYYPTVSREPYRNEGRITTHLQSGELTTKLGLDSIDPAQDRFMICGSQGMLRDCTHWLEEQGFKESRQGYKADYVIERAFVER